MKFGRKRTYNLFRKTKTRFVNVTLSSVMIFSSLSGALPILLSQKAAAYPNNAQVNLTSPTGGENWVIGTSHNITWASANNVGSVDIKYSSDNGSHWTILFSNVSSPNGNDSHAWDTTGYSPTTSAKIEIVQDYGYASDTSGKFTLEQPQPSVAVTAPTGGTSWAIGSTQNVTWTSANSVGSVDIDYSTNGNSWSTIKSNYSSPDGSDSYAWYINPNTYSHTSSAQIKVVQHNGSASDVSGKFSLVQPSINVTAPGFGTSWQAGSTHNITWTSSGVNTVDIDYSGDGGNNWSTVASGVTASDDSYSWTIDPSTYTPTTSAEIKVVDDDISSVYDTSDLFNIPPTAPVLTTLGTQTSKYVTLSWTPGTGTPTGSHGAVYATEWSSHDSFNSDPNYHQVYTANTDSITVPNDGTYYWRVEVCYPNEGIYTYNCTWSDAASFTVNTYVAPSVAVNGPTGTTGANPTLQWTGTNGTNTITGYTIKWSENDTSYGNTVTVSGTQGANNYTLSNLPSGTLNWEVDATDGTDTSAYATGSFTVDATPPVITVNSLLTNNTTPVLTGTVDDPTATITLTVDGSPYDGTNNGDGTWSVNVTNPVTPDGSYQIQATATDPYDNSSTIDGTLTIDTIAPQIEIDNTTPVAYYGATDPINVNVIDANLSHTYIAQNGSVFKDYGNSEYFSLSWLAEGTYQIYSVDGAGNQSATYTFTIDRTAPTVPTDGTPNNSYEKTNNFWFNWNASTDNVGPVTYELIASKSWSSLHTAIIDTNDGSTVIGNCDGSGVWDSVQCGAGSGQFPLTGPTDHSTGASDGTWYWAVRAIDEVNNDSGWSDIWNVTIDTVPPTITITSPAVDGVVNNSANIVVNVSDNIGFGSNNKVSLAFYDYTGGKCSSTALPQYATVYFTGNPATITESLASLKNGPLADGTYCIKASAEDAAGNYGIDQGYVFTVDNTAPQIQIDSVTPPTPVAYYGIGDTVNTHVIDANYGNTYIYQDNNGVVSATPYKVYDTAAGSWFGLWWLPQGTYQIYSVDQAGNQSATYTFVIDDSKPTVNFTAPTPADNAYVNDNFTVGYNAQDNDALKSVVVALYNNNAPNSWLWLTTCYENDAETGASDSGTCTVVLPADLADGAYTLQVGAQDQAGNWSVNADETINVDRTAPKVTVNNQTTTSTTPTVTGTVDDSAATVSVAVNGGSYKATVNPTVNGSGTYDWSADVTNALTAGNSYPVAVIATDEVGNVGTAAGSLTINTIAATIVHNFVKTTTGNGTGNGGNNGGGGNGGNTGNVLGASTNTPNNTGDDNGQVKGDSTSTPSTSNNSNKKDSSNFLGLGWWWLLILAIVAFILYYVYGRRSNDEA